MTQRTPQVSRGDSSPVHLWLDFNVNLRDNPGSVVLRETNCLTIDWLKVFQVNELFIFHTFSTKRFNQGKAQSSGFKLQHGKIKVWTKHHLLPLISQRCQYSIPVRGWGEWLSPGRKLQPKGEKKICLVAISKQVSKLQKGLQPLWLAGITHKKRTKILQGMLIILIAQGFPMQSTTT